MFMMFLEDTGWYSVLGVSMGIKGAFIIFLAAEGWYSVVADCLETEEAPGDGGGGEPTISVSAFTLEEVLAVLLPMS